MSGRSFKEKQGNLARFERGLGRLVDATADENPNRSSGAEHSQPSKKRKVSRKVGRLWRLWQLRSPPAAPCYKCTVGVSLRV